MLNVVKCFFDCVTQPSIKANKDLIFESYNCPLGSNYPGCEKDCIHTLGHFPLE